MEAPELKATKRTSARSTASVEPAQGSKPLHKGRLSKKPSTSSLKKSGGANGTKKPVAAGPKPAPIPRVIAAAPPAALSQGVGHIGDVYDPECPSQKALETIATKWAILVLHTLIAEPMRFSKLQLTLSGISQKVLTQQLRKLEKTGLIHRHVRPTSPPSVVYEVTHAGHELRAALSGLCDWANKHAVALGIAQKTKINSRC